MKSNANQYKKYNSNVTTEQGEKNGTKPNHRNLTMRTQNVDKDCLF